MSKTSQGVILILAALGLVAIGVIATGAAGVNKLGGEVLLPFVAICGIVLLLGTLALVSIAFGAFGLSDKTQAMALPEGSIRAVLALSVVVLFAILSVFLYDKLASGGPIVKLEQLTEPVKNEFIKNNPGLRDVVVTPSLLKNEQGVVQKDDKGADVYVYTIAYGTPHNQQSDDFAKQLLVMLGTLLTSIAAFYFGAKTAAAAQTQDKGPPQPTVRSIEPTFISLTDVGALGHQFELQVKGDNLNSIKQVKITKDNSKIEATDVVSNDSLISCKIAVDATTPQGKWDVEVVDGSSKSAKLEKALEIRP
jgi:hypothetical protein